jgi:ubiquinone/menaquinone biosynthesis C-methylase UbiE
MFLKTAQLYDLFYGSKDYAAETQELHAFIKKHKRSQGNQLLDVACGTGRHAQFLKRLYKVEGLDLDGGLLELARERHPDLEFHEASMIDFDIDHEFDVIACLFSSIGYVKTIDNLNKAINNMSKHLVPGGVLLVEPWFGTDAYFPGMAHASFIDQPGLKACRMNVSRIEDGMSVLEFHYLVAQENDDVHHFRERHELGLFSKEEHIQAFRNSGLRVSYDDHGLTGRGLCIGVKP